MLTETARDRIESEVLVVGAGAIGLVAAMALARAGRRVTLLGRPGDVRPGRTVALLQGSVDLLRDLDVWSDLEPHAEALRTMRIVDATGSLFAPPPVEFRAAEIGLPAFGYNVDNGVLESALREAAARTPGLAMMEAAGRAATFTRDFAAVETDGGDILRACLVVGADGRESMVRKAARIGVRSTAHPQRAMTAVFSHDVSHENVSTEFHTREGPFTLVPMPDASARRSSLVWVMAPGASDRRRLLSADAFAREAETQCGRLLGRMRLEGAVGTFPIVTRTAVRLVGPRSVLLGEAAHALPPIGAQGLNLSFRDVTVLADRLRPRGPGSDDAGLPERLAAYEAGRRGDVASRTTAVDLLNNSLLAHGPGMDLLRGAGLAALGRVGPLRRFVMRHGLAPDARPTLAG